MSSCSTALSSHCLRFVGLFSLTPLYVEHLKTALKLTKSLAGFSLSIGGSQRKNFQASMSLEPKEYTVLQYWSLLFIPWSLSQNITRAQSSWNACRGSAASQFTDSSGKDLFSIVCGWSWKQCGFLLKCANKKPVGFELSSNMHVYYSFDNHIYSFTWLIMYSLFGW